MTPVYDETAETPQVAAVRAERPDVYPAIERIARHYDPDNGWHDIVPGIDVDAPEHPDLRWCNTCGRAVTVDA